MPTPTLTFQRMVKSLDLNLNQPNGASCRFSERCSKKCRLPSKLTTNDDNDDNDFVQSGLSFFFVILSVLCFACSCQVREEAQRAGIQIIRVRSGVLCIMTYTI